MKLRYTDGGWIGERILLAVPRDRLAATGASGEEACGSSWAPLVVGQLGRGMGCCLGECRSGHGSIRTDRCRAPWRIRGEQLWGYRIVVAGAFLVGVKKDDPSARRPVTGLGIELVLDSWDEELAWLDGLLESLRGNEFSR